MKPHPAPARIVLSLTALVLLVTGALLYAGPLDPPAGPVTSTYKTLTEVEPRVAINATNTPGDADSLYKITQPGAYYLTGNITGVVGKHGIEIVASGVTVDLNGFDLAGVAGMGPVDGVSVTVTNLNSIAVVNGSVRNWGAQGVNIQNTGAATSNCRVADVRASGNAGIGITIGPGGTISNCSSSFNTGNGFFVGNGAVISSCAAFSNTGSGINTAVGSTVVDCAVRLNTLDGIVCGTGCLIRSNTCSNNGNPGDGAGIHATGADNRIEGNNCTTTDRGIQVDTLGNIIIRNTCSGNTADWVIVANNVVGPILDRRAPASAAINGFSAPDSTGSTHPNANFSY